MSTKTRKRPKAIKPIPCDPGPGYRLLGEDEPNLKGDQINAIGGGWQKPLASDDMITLRWRRQNLSMPEARRSFPGRAEQIQVRRKIALASPADGLPAEISAELLTHIKKAVGGITYLADLAKRQDPRVNAESWHEWNAQARAIIARAESVSPGQKDGK